MRGFFIELIAVKNSLQRNKTLLQEYKQRGKSNTFLDHRFGEKDETLTEDDRAILRFQRERQVCPLVLSSVSIGSSQRIHSFPERLPL